MGDIAGTQSSALELFENTLCCSICRQKYESPVILSCGHSFCSLCIRRNIDEDSHCPECRAPAQTSQLRPNKAVEDIVAGFRSVRNLIASGVAARSSADKEQDEQSSSKDSCKTGAGAGEPPVGATGVGTAEVPRPGEAPCPLCGKSFPITFLQGSKHIDECLRPQKRPKSGEFPSKRLPALNYALFSETKLRQLLSEAGLSTKGNRSLMESRHREWRNIWNANLDRQQPLKETVLRKKLVEWERVRGFTPKFLIKDINGKLWIEQHHEAYAELIAAAQRSKKKAQGLEQKAEPANTLDADEPVTN